MAQEYLVGVMMTPVENPDESCRASVEAAVELVEAQLAQRVPNLRLELFEFMGPHLSPASGGYSPLELLQLGVIEKVEREPNFLVVVTEVDISSQLTTYMVALPSRLTTVGVISTKRLTPRFWPWRLRRWSSTGPIRCGRSRRTPTGFQNRWWSRMPRQC